MGQVINCCWIVSGDRQTLGWGHSTEGDSILLEQVVHHLLLIIGEKRDVRRWHGKKAGAVHEMGKSAG